MPEEKKDKKFNLIGLLGIIFIVNIFLAIAAYLIDLIYWIINFEILLSQSIFKSITISNFFYKGESMFFKYLVILGVLFLLSCGGGSSYGGGTGGGTAAASNSGQITDQLQIVE